MGRCARDVDFGYRGNLIGGNAWYDSNTNGIQDGGELTGVSNVIVRLYDGNSNLVATTTTDTNGNLLLRQPDGRGVLRRIHADFLSDQSEGSGWR